MVRPRIVFVSEHELGNETRYMHDILIIHCTNGLKFVFDPTGYQFGFGDYLHEWRKYRAKFVDRKAEARRRWLRVARPLLPLYEISSYNEGNDDNSRLMQQARVEEIGKDYPV